MLIRAFKYNYPYQVFLLALISIILWAGAFLNIRPPAEFHRDTYTALYNLLVYPLQEIIWLNVSLAFILTIAEAIMLNNILINSELIPRNTLFPALIFVLLMSYSPVMQSLNPVLISGLFLILATDSLTKIYGSTEAYRRSFNTGFFIALAAMFYYPAIWFIAVVWFSFLSFSLFSWREWAISVIGLILPYVFLFTYYFLIDKLDYIIDQYALIFQEFLLPEIELNIFNYAIAVIFVLFLFISISRVFSSITEMKIQIRKNFQVLLWLLFVAIFSVFFSGGWFIVHLSFIVIPASVFISWHLYNLHRSRWQRIGFYILVVLILVNNFRYYVL